MNQKEHLKNLMSHFLKNAQETDLKSALQGNPTDPKKNFLVLDNLIAKLKKDLSTTSDAAFTAAKDTELFVQDLTNSSSFIKYLYNNKVALDGKQLVLDHNATGAEKFIDLEYSQLSADLKKLYFPFPEGNQDYWVYKDGIEKFLHSKMEEAEKSTDQGFKNILKTLLKKLYEEINSLAPSLKVTPQKPAPTITDKKPETTDKTSPATPGSGTGKGKSIQESVFAQWIANPGRLPLYEQGITLSRINAFAELYVKTLTTYPDANVQAKTDGVEAVLSQIISRIAVIRQYANNADTLLLNVPVPQRNIGSGPQPNPFRTDIASDLNLDYTSPNPLPTFKTKYINYLREFMFIVTKVMVLINDIKTSFPVFNTPLVNRTINDC